MIGAIYLITNIYHLENQLTPVFYIGSKKNIDDMDDYWSSSAYLQEDIEKLGKENFQKVTLMEFNTKITPSY
jgi:hypothetical protein